MLTAALTGLATGFSLILAIGAQNAFVLRQGLMRARVFAVCLTCAVGRHPHRRGRRRHGHACRHGPLGALGAGAGRRRPRELRLLLRARLRRPLAGPLFARPRAWTVLDIAIAMVMWSIATALIASVWEE